MKNQRKRSLMAMLLAVSILFTLPVWATSSARALDGEENYTLTINSGREAGDDIENAEVVIDLYKVANAVAVEGYDTYDYELLEAYSDLAGRSRRSRSGRRTPETMPTPGWHWQTGPRTLRWRQMSRWKLWKWVLPLRLNGGSIW